jgi:hypothetical protein
MGDDGDAADAAEEPAPSGDAKDLEFRKRIRQIDREIDRLRQFMAPYHRRGESAPDVLVDRLNAALRTQDEVMAQWRHHQIDTFVDPGW